MSGTEITMDAVPTTEQVTENEETTTDAETTTKQFTENKGTATDAESTTKQVTKNEETATDAESTTKQVTEKEETTTDAETTTKQVTENKETATDAESTTKQVTENEETTTDAETTTKQVTENEETATDAESTTKQVTENEETATDAESTTKQVTEKEETTTDAETTTKQVTENEETATDAESTTKQVTENEETTTDAETTTKQVTENEETATDAESTTKLVTEKEETATDAESTTKQVTEKEETTTDAETTTKQVTEKKRDRRNRTTARTKFTRTYNVIAKCIADKDAEVETLQTMLVNLEDAYSKLEHATEDYLNHLESDDEEFEQSNRNLEKSYELLCGLQFKLSKRSTNKHSDLIGTSDDLTLVKHEQDDAGIDAELNQILDDKENRDAWGNKAEFLLASIGLAVGVGNVWRFPYLCQKNGGGAFLIPYFTMMLFQGFPLFIMEFAMGQRMKQSAVRCWNNVHPVFFGVGISCMLVSFAMCSYYIVVITWCLFYFFVSFTSDLPWQAHYCERYPEWNNITSNLTWWEAKNQSDPNTSYMTSYLRGLKDNFTDCCVRDPPQYFWYHNALQATSVMEQVGDVNWKLFGCLAMGWLVVYFCVLKGVKSSGKAAYFTATFPYVLLFILFIRGVTLDGAGEGIKIFFTPDLAGIWKFQAWLDAATQIFYSLSIGFGALIAFSSYMPRKNNCVNDAMIVVLVNCGTSLFAGIVTFSFLGYRFKKTGIPVTQVGSGPGLAFMTYCEAFLLLEVSPLWAILFFMMMVLLGIDSEFGTLEGAVAPLYDLGWVTMRKEKFMGLVAAFFVVVEIIFCLGDGYYLFQVFDDYSVPLPLLIIALCQVVALGWVYGVDQISNDIEYMTGRRPRFIWMLCWKYISPGIMIVVFIGYLVTTISSTPTYRGYVGCEQNPFDASISEGTISWYKKFKYPWWAQLLAAVLVLLSTIPIPYYFIKNWKKGMSDKIIAQLKCKSTYYPDPTWIEPERRVSIKETERRIREEDKEMLIRTLAEEGEEKYIKIVNERYQTSPV